MPSVRAEVKNDQGTVFARRVLDMSADGIRFEYIGSQAMKKGDHLKVRFYYTRTLETICTNALVRHCSPIDPMNGHSKVRTYQLGCEFDFPNVHTKTSLSQWSTKESTKAPSVKPAPRNRLTAHLSFKSNHDWSFRSVCSSEELRRAFSFVYQAYHKRNYINENKDKTFFHFHALLPHTWTFVATNQLGQIGGTVTLIPDSANFGLPLERMYPEEIQKLRQAGYKLGEVGMFAIDKTLFPKRSFSLHQFSEVTFLFQLYRSMFLCASRNLDLNELVIVIHPKHIPIYRSLYFTECGGIRPCKSVNDAPAVFMHMNIPETLETIRRENKPLYRFFTPKETATDFETIKHVLKFSDINYFLQKYEAASRLTNIERGMLFSLYQPQINAWQVVA